MDRVILFLFTVYDLTNKIVEYKIDKETFPTCYGSWKQLEIAELKALYDVKTFVEQFCRNGQSSILNKTQNILYCTVLYKFIYSMFNRVLLVETLAYNK